MEHDHRRIDRYVHMVLRAGMVLSISVLVFGLLLYVLSPGGVEEDLPLDKIAEGLLEGNPIAFLDLGIVLLILTPLSRVLTAAVVFVVDREPRFVAVSLIVITAIALAIAVG